MCARRYGELCLLRYLPKLLHGPHHEEPSIVDQVVDLAHPFNFLVDARLGLRQVQLYHLAPRRLDLLDGRAGLGPAAHGADYAVACSESLEAEEQPEAVRGAGDEPDWWGHGGL